MKRIVSVLFFAVLILESFSLLAQVPGFLGRRTTVYLSGGGTSPVFTPSKYVNQLDIYFGGGIDYAITKSWSAGIEYQSLTIPQTISIDNDNPLEVQDNNGEVYYYSLKTNMYKLSVARMATKSDYIAPIGQYFSFNLIFMPYSVYDSENHFFGKNKTFYEGGTTALGVSFGSRRAFGNRLVFNYSISSAYILVDFKGAGGSGSSLKGQLFKDVNKRLQNYMFINASISMGYLL